MPVSRGPREEVYPGTELPGNSKESCSRGIRLSEGSARYDRRRSRFAARPLLHWLAPAGRAATWQRIFPAAAIASTSRRSSSRADRGRLNVYLKCRHRYGRKADGFRRQADDQERSAGPDTSKGGVISSLRGGSDDCGVCSARSAHLLNDVFCAGVYCRGCAQTPGMRELLVGDINSSNKRSQPDADLHRQVTQSTDAKHRQTLTWLNFRVLQRAVHSYSGAEKRRSLDRRKPTGNLRGVTCGNFDVFRESSIHGYAGNLLFDAEIFVAVAAELAFAAASNAARVFPRGRRPLNFPRRRLFRRRGRRFRGRESAVFW